MSLYLYNRHISKVFAIQNPVEIPIVKVKKYSDTNEFNI